MLTISIDTQDCLINGQLAEVSCIGIDQNSISKVYVELSDPQADLKAMTASYLIDISRD